MFSNKQLAMLYITLTKIMRISELKVKNNKSTPHFKVIKTFRHHILQEMLLKSRYKENSIDDIRLKYFENIQEAIQQLVNKNQFLNDFKVIVNNLDKFTKEQLKEYFNFIKNGILKYLIFQFSAPEIKNLYSKIEEIPRNIKIKNKKNLLTYIATKGDPFYELKTEEKRVKDLKLCLVCKKNGISEKHRPLCKSCFDEKTSSFPNKYFSEEHAFMKFSELFDKFYQNYNDELGYLIIEIDLPFDSPFTVMDLEATGDITKDKTQFITTMGYLFEKKAFIYQLINFSKQKKFAKLCKQVANGFNRPAVAYNFEGSERIWLRIFMGGWIDIQKKEIMFSEEIGEELRSVKLEEVSFEWDDISGLECIERCQLYQDSGDITHLIIVAYHNFIDILREYIVGLVNLKVYDYLDGKIWNPLNNRLVNRYECPVCYNDFYSQDLLTRHVVSHKRRRSRKRKL